MMKRFISHRAHKGHREFPDVQRCSKPKLLVVLLRKTLLFRVFVIKVGSSEISVDSSEGGVKHKEMKKGGNRR